MKRSMLWAALLLSAACMDELPTAATIDAPKPPALSIENALALQGAYTDALERVLPALDGDASALRSALESVAAVLETAPARDLDALLRRATTALDGLAPIDANTMTIALVIERTRTLAQPQAAPSTEE